MRYIYQVIVLLVVIITLQACTQQRQIPNQEEVDPTPAWSSKVHLKGMELEVDNVQDWYNQNQGLKVSATVRSTSYFETLILYRYLWFTEDGQPISTILGKWSERLLKPGQTIELTQVGPGVHAQDYRLEIIKK
jgi:uncharacterized protein YcfL